MKALTLMSSEMLFQTNAWNTLPSLNAFWTSQNLIDNYYGQVGDSFPYLPFSNQTQALRGVDKYESKSDSTTKDLGSMEEAQIAYSKIGKKSMNPKHSSVYEFSLELSFR